MKKIMAILLLFSACSMQPFSFTKTKDFVYNNQTIILATGYILEGIWETFYGKESDASKLEKIVKDAAPMVDQLKKATEELLAAQQKLDEITKYQQVTLAGIATFIGYKIYTQYKKQHPKNFML